MIPRIEPVPAWPEAMAACSRAASTCLGLPFDACRAAWGCAVQNGLAPRSMLWSREVERSLDALEHLMLGPMARHA